VENICTRETEREGERERGREREEVTGEWRKLHSGELRKSYSSLYIIRVMRLMSVRLVEYAARVGKFDMQTFNRSD
jgi:hypothetical protein